MTAIADGEIPASQARSFEAHLTACPSCAAEAESHRLAVRRQADALARVLLDDAVDVPALRLTLQRRLNAVRAEEERHARPGWTWFLRPLSLATAGLAVALVMVLNTGGSDSVLVSLGVEPPPPELETRTDLFQYLDVIKRLEALEHFDAVRAVRLDEERALADSVRLG
jgi:anti-sigma factor RsiW